MSDPSDPLIGQVIDGRYRIESLLGEGGMGMVYRAKHTALNKPLAIKVLRPEVSKNEEIVARFKQEAQSASAIGNQHIIDISDFGVLPDGSTYFVMEFLEGQSLTDALEAERFSTERTIAVAKQLCNALGAAHDSGIVHRDMKPDNVQLIPRGGTNDFVKVLDFGIAKVGGSSTKLTQAGQVFGTPHYMSPEQCSGTNVDHRTDIYAVGVILYEMATGNVPFDADNLMGILTKHLYENPIPPHELPPPTDVPAAVEAIILKCLAKKAEQRYQTMRELAADLDAAASGATPRAVMDQVGRHSRTSDGGSAVQSDDMGRMTTGVGQPAGIPKRSPVMLIAIGVLVLGGGVVAALALGGDAQEEQAVAAVEPEPNVVQPAPQQPAVETPPPEPEEPPAEPEAKPERVKMTLDSKPSGAEVYRDGDLVGSTPFAMFKPDDNEKVRLILKREGYEDKSVLVRPLSPKAMSVRLTKEAPPEKEKSRRARSSRRRKSTSSASSKDKPVTKPKPKPSPGRLKSEVLDPWD